MYVYTHVSPILQCIGPCYVFGSFRSIFVYNTNYVIVIVFKSNYCFQICVLYIVYDYFKTGNTEADWTTNIDKGIMW